MNKWIIKDDDAATVAKLSDALGITELTAKVLIHRGITEIADAEIFLNPSAQKFHDPYLMFGMREAVDRIIIAIENGENICLYGDYDVDGMSGTAILVRALKNLGGNVDYYIPRRVEGYGLNVPALRQIIRGGATLLISVDCGISNSKEIDSVKDSGLDFIITDHHLPAQEKITGAVAVIDSKQPECNYPDKNLCGAGVAFKLCQALMNKLEGIPFEDYVDDIDLVALATIADLVPLTGENRKVVQMGLTKMRDSDCLGLRALVKVSGLEGKNIPASAVAFQIAPRLNSIGRLKTASIGLRLFLTENESEAERIAVNLDDANTKRKDIEKDTFLKADEQVSRQREFGDGNMWTLVVADRSWNPGVIGLTASRLVEKYNVPTIVISAGDVIARGSCRSIPALHMKNALDSFADLFENYGGHSQAAGFSIPTKNIDELKRRFDEYVKSHLRDEDFPKVNEIDALIHPAQIGIKTAEEFAKLEPCGVDNPEPILACRNVHCGLARAIGVDNLHLSFVVLNDNDPKNNVKAVSFGNAALMKLVDNEPVDFVYKVGLDYWNGEARVNCYVSDITPTGIDETPITRENLIDVYQFLKELRKVTDEFNLHGIATLFNERTGNDFSVAMMVNALNIFRELGLLKVDDVEHKFELPRVKKRNLENSRTFRLLNNLTTSH